MAMDLLSFLFDKLYSVAPSLIMLTLYFLFQFWQARSEEPYDEASGPLNVNNSREWVFLMEGIVFYFGELLVVVPCSALHIMMSLVCTVSINYSTHRKGSGGSLRLLRHLVSLRYFISMLCCL
jgi:hypothetical protein